jgi:hypothetical protein
LVSLSIADHFLFLGIPSQRASEFSRDVGKVTHHDSAMTFFDIRYGQLSAFHAI